MPKLLFYLWGKEDDMEDMIYSFLFFNFTLKMVSCVWKKWIKGISGCLFEWKNEKKKKTKKQNQQDMFSIQNTEQYWCLLCPHQKNPYMICFQYKIQNSIDVYCAPPPKKNSRICFQYKIQNSVDVYCAPHQKKNPAGYAFNTKYRTELMFMVHPPQKKKPCRICFQYKIQNSVDVYCGPQPPKKPQNKQDMLSLQKLQQC